TVHQAGELVEFSVSSSKPVDKDTHVTLQIRPEMVASYNEKTGRTYEVFDADMYTFVKQEVTIPAGKNVSDPFVLSIDKVFEPGVFYCLPISITGTDGSMPVLDPSSTIYVIFRAPVHSKAVYIGTGNKYIVPSFYEQYDADPMLKTLAEMTLECRVYLDEYTTSDPYISSVMGFEGNVCMCFGDVKIGWDVLQVCMGDYQPAAINNPCNLKTWYHVAAVWSRTSLALYIDGQFMTETPTQGELVDITGVWLWNGTGIGFALGAGSN
ncbi:MAG: DUF1735 and LamG domain-containing protein, partial [Alistipes sp.]|nr:DUF1735 and LamG domain-containing protein [Alistipes sp.]